MEMSCAVCGYTTTPYEVSIVLFFEKDTYGSLLYRITPSSDALRILWRFWSNQQTLWEGLLELRHQWILNVFRRVSRLF